ncbi:acylphosphatase [Paraburkholderia caribensis]|uniref:acylphosphatase n=1 Tax=Paraburkholderia caribensis TaxID=75105 RepID=UPI00078DF67E|nr:acylphosphatase [Paraburkholderia caribensis]AMV45536.1 acylphosphatase [Paraburkholderia caribensis]
MAKEPDDLIKTLLIRVHGTVQGIGYRAACVQHAQSLDITGWVRNHADGSVEALLQGAATAVNEMRDWMADGMPAALVDRMEAEELAPPFARFDDFRQVADG